MEPVNGESMQKLSIEELLAIYENNDRELFEDEVFCAIRNISSRGASSYRLRKK